MTAVSVVIPVGRGEDEWRGLLEELAAALPPGCEVLLAAAEPASAPPGWPRHLPLRCVVGGRGRAGQLNEGARAAVAPWLWFLHADTRLSAGAVPAMLAFAARDEPALGWFDLGFRADGPALVHLNAYGANLRSAWLGMPFGDQGFLLPARVFAALGGFREDARYGEDHLLAWSARQAGVPLRRVGARLRTSARKYRRGGWLRTTVRHLWLTLLQAWPEWRRLRGQR